ncbi:MAG: N-acetylmuramoyl-L-alanine amidase [Rhodospirillales bacterium]|nr:N-acetylmuramoyl-L-alanine amidase [Rhodospirillales bacterium]
MFPFIKQFFVILSLTLLSVFLWKSEALALSVDGIRIGAHPDRTRLVLELSDKADFRVFLLPAPYRMVIDLPQAQWRAGTLPRATGISGLRQGRLEDGLSRLVLDLDRPVSVRAAFFLPRSGTTPDRLVVDFSPVPETVFQSEREKVYGTLAHFSPSQILPPVAPPAPKPQDSPAAQALLAPAAGLMAAPPIPSRKPERFGAQTPPRPVSPTEKPMIVIDPGHGGVDPGAIGANGVFEKNVTLAIARELHDQLIRTGRYRVKLTRDSDVYLRLPARVAFARKHGADLFISIHADSTDRSDVRGASIYTLSEKASDAQTAKLAERENRADLIAGVDLSGEDADVANILVDLAMRETMNQSKFLANTIVLKMNENGLKVLENPHRFAGFAVLKAPDIPSILLESGFMSSPKEAQMLARAPWRRKIAQSLVSGIDAYFSKLARAAQ